MSVQAKFQYLKPLEKWNKVKPYQIIGRRPHGQPRENIERQVYDYSVVDVESLDYKPSLDEEGFQWIRQKLVEDFQDEASTMRYVRATEVYLKELLGAKDVLTYDYQTRNRVASRLSPQIRPVSNTVHIDITPEGAMNRILFNFPDKAVEILKSRFRLLSVWRPLFGPILDYPLAVCDSRSVSEDDLVESDYIYPNLESETFMVKANEVHRWFYMKEQDQDDALLITNYDSATGKRVPHSGFELPPDERVTRLRESFEMKVVVYYEREGANVQ